MISISTLKQFLKQYIICERRIDELEQMQKKFSEHSAKYATIGKTLEMERDIRPRSVLRNAVIASVCNKVANIISAPRKFVMNNVERFTVVVFGKICHILQKYDGRVFHIDYFSDFKEQISAFVRKSFLFSANRKRLARKACRKYIEIRDIIFIDCANIAFDQNRIGEIVPIGHTSVFIYIVSPYDFMPGLRKGKVYSADSAK